MSGTLTVKSEHVSDEEGIESTIVTAAEGPVEEDKTSTQQARGVLFILVNFKLSNEIEPLITFCFNK